MFETNEAWKIYFEELEPQRRLQMLGELPDDGDGAKELCRTLCRERYVDPKHPGRNVDTWLWKFAYLPGLYRKWKFVPGAVKKEMQGTRKELHLESPEKLSRVEKKILYLEYRNAARRYLSTCRGSRYGRRFLGMKEAADEEKLARACEDIWIVSRGFAHTAGMEKSMELWCEALHDELISYDPNSRKYYDELELKIQK